MLEIKLYSASGVAKHGELNGESKEFHEIELLFGNVLRVRTATLAPSRLRAGVASNAHFRQRCSSLRQRRPLLQFDDASVRPVRDSQDEFCQVRDRGARWREEAANSREATLSARGVGQRSRADFQHDRIGTAADERVADLRRR